MIGEVTGRSYSDFGLTFRSSPVLLGGKIYPSLGFSPETVYMMAAEVDLSVPRPPNAASNLYPVLLKDVLSNQHLITDAQFLTGAFRLAHALGYIQ